MRRIPTEYATTLGCGRWLATIAHSTMYLGGFLTGEKLAPEGRGNRIGFVGENCIAALLPFIPEPGSLDS